MYREPQRIVALKKCRAAEVGTTYPGKVTKNRVYLELAEAGLISWRGNGAGYRLTDKGREALALAETIATDRTDH